MNCWNFAETPDESCFRLELAAAVRRLNHPTQIQINKIEQRRRTLRNQLSSLATEGEKYLPEATFEGFIAVSGVEDNVLFDLIDEEDSDEDTVYNFGNQEHSDDPEGAKTLLPSLLGYSRCNELGFADLANVERDLREGHMNDSLYQLQVHLSKKAFQFRTGIRRAKTQSKKTRAWGELAATDRQVKHWARVYNRSWRAWIKLCGTTDRDP